MKLGLLVLALCWSAGAQYFPPSRAPTAIANPNQTTGGCGVEYVSALSFVVGACTYTINGQTYTSAITTQALTAADGSNPRIDVIGVDITGVVILLTGTAAANPQQPTIDPATQLGLTFIYVAAGATTPADVVLDNIFDDNVEWTQADTANVAISTSNPYRGTTDVEATSAAVGNNTRFTKPSAGTVDLATRSNLVFYIRSKAVWPTGTSGATAARSLAIWWQNGATQRGSQVLLRDGVFGFSSATTTGYQQISIPTALFGNAGIPVTTLFMQVVGPSGSSTIGWYIDAVSLQGGLEKPANPVVVLSMPFYYQFLAGVCQGTTASLGFSTPTANAPTAVCITGTNTQLGAAQFTATGQTVQGWFLLPTDWVSGINNDAEFLFRSVGTTGNVVWDLATACRAVTGETIDPSWNAEQTVSTAAQGTTLLTNSGTISTFTTLTCSPGEMFFFKGGLDSSTTTSGNIDLLSLRFKIKRTITTY